MVLADLAAGTMAGFGICAVGALAVMQMFGVYATWDFCKVDFVISSISTRLACWFAGHPFDTMKVLMQTQPGKYKGMMDAARSIVSVKGAAGLYEVGARH